MFLITESSQLCEFQRTLTKNVIRGIIGNSELRSTDHSVPGRNQVKNQGCTARLCLGLLLSNVFINDIFFSMEDTEICIYAADTTIYVCSHELEHIVSSLETDAQKLSRWFLDNSMKLNPDRCHLSSFGEKNT